MCSAHATWDVTCSPIHAQLLLPLHLEILQNCAFNFLIKPTETSCVCIWKASHISYLIPRPRARTTALLPHRSWGRTDARSLCFWMRSPSRRWHEPSCLMLCLLGSMESSSPLEAQTMHTETRWMIYIAPTRLVFAIDQT